MSTAIPLDIYVARDNEPVHDFGEINLLMYACESNNPRLVKQQLKKGADPNEQDANGNCSLQLTLGHIFWFQRLDSYNICKMLIENGADVNTEDSHGGTPLIQAVRNMDVELVRLMLVHGACLYRNRKYCGKYSYVAILIYENCADCVIDLYKMMMIVKMLLFAGYIVRTEDTDAVTYLGLFVGSKPDDVKQRNNLLAMLQAHAGNAPDLRDLCLHKIRQLLNLSNGDISEKVNSLQELPKYFRKLLLLKNVSNAVL